jgi:hypothetical protein
MRWTPGIDRRLSILADPRYDFLGKISKECNLRNLMYAEGVMTYRMGTLSVTAAINSAGALPVNPLLIYPGDTLLARAKSIHSIARDLPDAG